jgi:deoxyribodipyrimidine photo-lyase
MRGYIRRWVPELTGLPAPAIHHPDPATRRARRYPETVVDHRQAMATHRARRAGR